MKTVSKLALAALVATTTPALASAKPHCEADHDHASHGGAAAPVSDRGWDRERDHGRDGWRERDGRWHRETWRERERAALRYEYARLDGERHAFHASRAGHHPRKVRRFERWYAAERAELDRRWAALDVYAWR